MPKRLPLAIALPLLAACADPAPAAPERDGYTAEESSGWIPVTRRRGVLLVPGTVAGVEARLLVDTGATHTIVDARLGLARAGDGTAAFDAVGGPVTAGELGEVPIGLGAWRILERRTATVDLAAACEAVGTRFHAVVGLPTFLRFVVDLDLAADRLRLIEPDAFYARELAGAVELPLRVVRLGPQVQAAIEGGPPVWLYLDTGSNAALTLTEGYVAERDLLAGRERRTTLWVGGAGGSGVAPAATLDAVALGDLELHAVPVTAVPLEADDAAGWLGMAILARFRCVFDLPRERLLLVSGDGWDRPFQRDRAGIAERLDGDALVVLHVSPGSPAEAAGVAVGDRIVAIDGGAVGADYWGQRSGWSRAAAGTRVALELASGRRVELVLADFY